MSHQEDLERLIEVLPKSIRMTIQKHPNKDSLIEIIMDLGRRPEARFFTHPEFLSDKAVSW